MCNNRIYRIKNKKNNEVIVRNISARILLKYCYLTASVLEMCNRC